MSQTTDQTRIIKAARDAANKLATSERELRDRHTALVRERAQTWGALASRDEVREQAGRLVEAARDRWRELHTAPWVRQLSGYREIRGVDHEREVRVPPRLPDLVGQLDFAALCGLAPETITASLAAMIDATAAERFGLPQPARDQRLAELDAQIADVEREHAALVDAAAEVGLPLAHLPTVAERRQAEAEEAERERLLADARARAATAPVEPNAWAGR